jgi:NADPH-dependent 2,4-dienoyl-CoA reductase/sulfur reductase-like enzyme
LTTHAGRDEKRRFNPTEKLFTLRPHRRLKTMGKSHVLIAGGGIGGLVAALALNQRGFDVSLYEQAPELHELGAGVTITPNGSRVLCRLACARP